MAKGAVGLLAGYWPENVPRYLQTPALGLDEAVIARPARRQPDGLALIDGADALTYAGLANDVETSALALRGDQGERPNEAASAHALLCSLLGAIRAGVVAVVDDAGARDGALTSREGVRIRTGRIDGATSSERPRRRSFGERALGFMFSDGGICYHSSGSLLAWAVSWSAFLSLTQEHVFLTLEPPHRWPGLTVALASFFRGGTCAFARAATSEELAAQIERHSPTYVMMSFHDAAQFAVARNERLRGALRRGVRAVFVALEDRFDVRQRRAIESALGVPVLTVLGSPVTGPVISAHPDWYLDEAVGLPLTNVELWPLDPRTSQPLAVPWEAVDQGEIGVRSPLVAIERPGADGASAGGSDEWVGIGQIAVMDPAGLFYLYPWR